MAKVSLLATSKSGKAGGAFTFGQAVAVLTLAACADVRHPPCLCAPKPIGYQWDNSGGISTFGQVVAALASASWTSVNGPP